MDGKAILDESQHFLVKAQRQVGMMAPLQEDLGTTELQGFLDLCSQLLPGQHISFSMSRGAVEGAKPTSTNAHIGVIDIPVHHVADHRLRVLSETDRVRQSAELMEIGLFVKRQRFIEADAIPCGNLADDGCCGHRSPFGNSFKISRTRSHIFVSLRVTSGMRRFNDKPSQKTNCARRARIPPHG